MTMYERSYGYRYEEVDKYTSAVDIAKKIRADIKQAVSEGLLPSRWKYSVRSDATAISVDVLYCADAFKPCDGGQGCNNVWCSARNDPAYAHGAQPHDVLTDEAEAARMTLKRIHGAYNHDGSEIQTDYFDVRYYGGVSFEDADSADFRRREKERLATKKNARQTGTPKRLYRNYSRTAGSVVHLTIETAEGKEVLACGARLSRSPIGDMLTLGTAEVTCSRCAKRATV
jgi:hypothetical protein